MLRDWKTHPRLTWRSFSLGMVGAAMSLYAYGKGQPAIAQIVPDGTLGSEASVVAPTDNVRGLPGILIQGGARRGANLFQSFSDFNVGAAQRVYFANPVGVETILSRVTGRNPSSILGTLGVDGMANLFLINPNGILFGQNARLDIAGSFVATTADRLDFGDGQFFSATAPQAPPLLTVSLRPGLQYGTNYQGDITNAGSLVVGAGQTLALAGRSVTSTGLLATPGGTVQVLGDRVSLLDNAQIDVSSTVAGGTVLIGGDFQGRAPLPTARETFIGPNVTINADGLTILRPSPDGLPPTPANGGRVIVWSDDTTQFSGTITARGGAIGGDGGFVEVSGRENLVFNGWVDAGAPNGRPGTLLLDPTNIEVVEGPGNGTLTDVFDRTLPNRGTDGTQISAALISAALINGFPNTVILDASNNITFSAPIQMTAPGAGITATAGNSIFVNSDIFTTRGNISLTAQAGDVVINSSEINSNAPETGIAGDISISAQNRISLVNSRIRARSDGTGGFSTIRLVSNQDSVSLNNSIVSATNFGTGFAGDILIDAPNRIDISNNSQLFSRGVFGQIFLGVSNSDELANRQVTNLPTTITITNSTLDAENETTNQGRIGVFAQNEIVIANSNLRSRSENTDTETFSRIEIFARSGSVALGSTTISTTNTDQGFAGDVVVSAAERLAITDSSIFSRGNLGQVLIGRSNDFSRNYPSFSPTEIDIRNSTLNTNNGSVTGNDGVNINAGRVSVRSSGFISLTNTSAISSSTERLGNAGAVSVQALNDTTLINSDIFSNVERNGIGDAGLVTVSSRSLFVLQGSQIQTLVRGPRDGERAGEGNAGAVFIVAPETVRVIGSNAEGFPSAIFTSVNRGATGTGGNVLIQTRSLHVRDRGKIDANNFGTGTAGNIFISALGVWVDNLGLITASSRLGEGGSVFLNVPGAIILGRSGDIVTDTSSATGYTRGAGNIAIGSGNLLEEITARGFAFRFDNRILLLAGKTFRDNNITAKGIFADGGFIRVNAFRLQDIARRADSIFTNDITAESEFGVSGDVVVSALNIFPSFRADPLPERYTPPQVSQGCDPRVRQESSRFTITGRGGLPADPTEILSPDTLAGTGSTPTATVPQQSPVASDTTIVPARGWVQQADGTIRLVAYATNPNAPVPNLMFPTPGACNVP